MKTLALITGSNVPSMIVTESTNNLSLKEMIITEEFEKIKINTLPSNIIFAIAKSYEGSTIRKIFYNKASNLFKIILKEQDEEKAIICNDTGEF